MKRYKKRAEQRLIRKSKKIAGGLRKSRKAVGDLPWDEAVVVLTGALTEAIWREGGEHEDAVATAEIVYYAMVRDLHTLFAHGNSKSGAIIPFKRKASYMREAR